MMEGVPGLLRVRAAARRLDVSVRTLYRLVASGELALVKVRAGSRIAEAELNSYIDRVTRRRRA